jgi:heme-degrading monooxygenase HmoA
VLISISRFEEQAAELDEGVRHVREEVVPAIQGAEGLRAAYWAVDRENGKRVSVLVWESTDAAAAAMPAVVEAIKQRRAGAGRTNPQASPTATERFEVIAQV